MSLNGNCFEELTRRGFLYQMTDEGELRRLLNESQVSFYVGFDPTANSLQVGNLVPIMAARLLQNAGHKPIMLVGGATALVGDPSGKQEARPILTRDEVAANAEAFKTQFSRFIRFDGGAAALVNNADWLKDMLYLDMLRDIGRHFSVNRMMSMDSVKQRMEAGGISFLEFNYMILQSYDFLVLHQKMGCVLQIGGQEQWGNIVGGIELVRRIAGAQVFGATFPLITDRNGQKFGKSVGNAVWLDPKRTSVFDYYQFWRNTDDGDVARLMKMFTCLPVDEIDRLCDKSGNINRAKEILAFEATQLAHGFDEARKSFRAAGSKFGFADPESKIATTSKIVETGGATDATADLPTFALPKSEAESGCWIVKLLTMTGLCSSNGEARRLIQQGGAYINDAKVDDLERRIATADFNDGQIILKAGKKNVRRIILS